MKKNRYLIILLTLILYLSFSVPSTSAANKQRHYRHQGHWVVRKVWVPSTNKKIRKPSTKHRRQGEHWKVKRVSVPPIYKKVRRHSLRYRHQGHWELKKVWGPSTNKKIRKPSTTHRRQGGHWKVKRVWVPPTPNYKKIMIPGYYNHRGNAVIGHRIRLVDQPGYWTKTWVWVANR